MSLYKSATYKKDIWEAINSSVGIEDLRDKTVLITGATGAIGSFIVDMLLEYNKFNSSITIIASSRSVNNLKKRFDSVKTSKLLYLEYDCEKGIHFEMYVDYIIHAGGNAHPEAFNKEPVETIVGNINGTYDLLVYAKKYSVKKFCYISSGEIYGQGDLELDSYDENYSGYLDFLSPRSSYPNSKRLAETLCASFTKQYGIDTVVVRLCHTYGPNFTRNDSRVSALFFKWVIEGKDIILKSSGRQLRSYCYIADSASAILTCLMRGEKAQAYNCSNNNSVVTIRLFANMIAECAGKKVIFENPTIDDLNNRTPIEKRVLNNEKIQSLGWCGKYSIEEGVIHTLHILQEK